MLKSFYKFDKAFYILYYEISGGDYGRQIDKAFKDMEKGITTTITEDKRGIFTVKKYKGGKKL